MCNNCMCNLCAKNGTEQCRDPIFGHSNNCGPCEYGERHRRDCCNFKHKEVKDNG